MSGAETNGNNRGRLARVFGFFTGGSSAPQAVVAGLNIKAKPSGGGLKDILGEEENVLYNSETPKEHDKRDNRKQRKEFKELAIQMAAASQVVSNQPVIILGNDIPETDAGKNQNVDIPEPTQELDEHKQTELAQTLAELGKQMMALKELDEQKKKPQVSEPRVMEVKPAKTTYLGQGGILGLTPKPRTFYQAGMQGKINKEELEQEQQLKAINELHRKSINSKQQLKQESPVELLNRLELEDGTESIQSELQTPMQQLNAPELTAASTESTELNAENITPMKTPNVAEDPENEESVHQIAQEAPETLQELIEKEAQKEQEVRNLIQGLQGQGTPEAQKALDALKAALALFEIKPQLAAQKRKLTEEDLKKQEEEEEQRRQDALLIEELQENQLKINECLLDIKNSKRKMEAEKTLKNIDNENEETDTKDDETKAKPNDRFTHFAKRSIVGLMLVGIVYRIIKKRQVEKAANMPHVLDDSFAAAAAIAEHKRVAEAATRKTLDGFGAGFASLSKAGETAQTYAGYARAGQTLSKAAETAQTYAGYARAGQTLSKAAETAQTYAGYALAGQILSKAAEAAIAADEEKRFAEAAMRKTLDGFGVGFASLSKAAETAQTYAGYAHAGQTLSKAAETAQTYAGYQLAGQTLSKAAETAQTYAGYADAGRTLSKAAEFAIAEEKRIAEAAMRKTLDGFGAGFASLSKAAETAQTYANYAQAGRMLSMAAEAAVAKAASQSSNIWSIMAVGTAGAGLLYLFTNSNNCSVTPVNQAQPAEKLKVTGIKPKKLSHG